MGLRSEFKKYQKRKEILDFLGEFGITEEMLKKIPSLFDLQKTRVEPTESEKQAIEQKYSRIPTIQELVSMYKDETEEFYPYGKPKDNA